jgi:hypothetical protein
LSLLHVLPSNLFITFSNILPSIRGSIQNIVVWCRHLYSSCGSAK